MAVHIACLDAASGNMLSRLAWDGTDRRTRITSNAIGKIERALTLAIETYRKLKNGNRQVIRIERVVVEAGGQAVLGQVLSER